jgi:hypothetical protein
MATGVAEIGTSVGLSEAEMVGTAMLTLTVATFVVGVMTWLVGESGLIAHSQSGQSIIVIC